MGRIKPVPWKVSNRRITLESLVGKNIWNLTGGSFLEIVHVFYSARIVTLRLFGGRCLVAKALPCKGVKI